MSKVLNKLNLGENLVYNFFIRGIGRFKGTFIKEENFKLFIKTNDGVSEFNRSDLYFYTRVV